MDAFDSSRDHQSVKLHSNPSSSQLTNELPLNQDENMIRKDYYDLKRPARRCLDSLCVFPKDAVIKTRHAIYWWIGHRYLLGYGVRFNLETEEKWGWHVIQILLDLGMIIPYCNGKYPVVKKFKINPLVHGLLSKSSYNHSLSLRLLEPRRVILRGKDRSNVTRVIFNVGASYVNFESQWLAKQKNLRLLQLGRWQDSPLYHIEVGSEKFLKELRGQKQLRYLSLRGISEIFELPPSIAQLGSLKILDLKACHNLETLPNDIASMKSLTHLILSKCYLLEGMPKGIEKLTRLQVLKGFVISSSIKTPCRISDLANLKDLRRLSIHIANEAEIKDSEFESLKELSFLEHLKISWGVSDKRYSAIHIILPPRLRNLQIEGYRGQKIPEWMKPSKLPESCEELNITGGNLESMDEKWSSIEILRLKYLKHLKTDSTNLRELFPSLKYAELNQVSNHPYIEERYLI